MQLKTTGLNRIPGWFSVMKNKQQQQKNKKPSLQPPSYYQVPEQSAAEAASLSLQVSSLEGQLCSLTACAQTMAQLLILWPDSVLCFHIMPPINDRSDTLHTLTHSLWLQRAGRIANVSPLLQNTTSNIWNIRERITSEKWCCSSVTDLMETCQLLHAAEEIESDWLKNLTEHKNPTVNCGSLMQSDIQTGMRINPLCKCISKLSSPLHSVSEQNLAGDYSSRRSGSATDSILQTKLAGFEQRLYAPRLQLAPYKMTQQWACHQLSPDSANSPGLSNILASFSSLFWLSVLQHL